MIHLKNSFLLPSFIATNLTPSLVDEYFAKLPPATNLTADILSDNVGFDSDIPFSHNVLLHATQKLINSDMVNKVTILSILNTMDYIDFKYALIFFIELRESFSYDFLLSCLEKQNNYVFLERLNIFLSVFTPEFLCIDNHESLL